MDRSLKERLVGATVLVALGVVLIPWILDGPDEQEASQSSEIAIQLPLPDQTAADASSSVRHRTIEIGRDQAASNSPSDVTSEPETANEDPTTARSAPSTASQALSTATEATADGVTATAPTEPKPAPTAAAQRSEPVSVPAIVADDNADEVEVVVASATTLGKGWMVQLGSFGDQGNAKRQADRIKTFGHAPRIFEFSAGGRTMYRVRLGPVDSRDSAEATASALAAHGFVAQLVAPE